MATAGECGRQPEFENLVGQPERDEALPEEVVDEGVLFESGRPVVFVPFIQKGGMKLERVMLCWDGSRNAARELAGRDLLRPLEHHLLQRMRQVLPNECIMAGNVATYAGADYLAGVKAVNPMYETLGELSVKLDRAGARLASVGV